MTAPPATSSNTPAIYPGEEHLESALLIATDAWTSWIGGSVPQCDIAVHHSITASARASNVGGTATPSALAVLRLITSSNLVGCSIGRSAGFVPRKRFPANRAARSDS